MAGFNTVDSVVKGYIDKFPAIYKPEDYWTLLRHALTWFNQADRQGARARATVEIMLQPDRTAVLPDDYIDWLVVGRIMRAPGGAVFVRNLAFNAKVPQLPSTVPAGVPVPAGILPTATCFCYDGWAGEPLYGWGDARYAAAEFVVDADTRTLYTNSELEEGPLYLQYIFDATKPNVATPISANLALSLEYWMEWQMNRRASDASLLKKEYFDEVKRVARLASPMDAAQLYNIFDNTTYGQL